MTANKVGLLVPAMLFLVFALSPPSQTSANSSKKASQSATRGQPLVILTANDEAFSSCPPGTVFQKKYGNRGWCVETTPDMYGGGQAKDTEVLVPEESTGPSPFGDQRPRTSRRWKYY